VALQAVLTLPQDREMHSYRTYSEAIKLAEMSARRAHCASTKQIARELWKIAQEYQAEAGKLNGGTPPDIGDPPPGVEG
jgi:hypothetical protein